MKFIRTKDDLFGFFNIMSISLGKEKPKGKYYRSVVDRKLHRIGAGVLQNKYIVKQADTIEELCDEGVCNNSLTGFVDIRGFELYKKYKCYGAIWTDKGLIYVAKMNDKGELELL